MKPEKGQEVWLIPERSNIPQKKIVERVGRKYFYLQDDWDIKYRIEDWVKEKDWGWTVQIYPSLQAIEDEIEHTSLSRELGRKFSTYGKLPYSLEVLREINELISTKK